MCEEHVVEVEVPVVEHVETVPVGTHQLPHPLQEVLLVVEAGDVAGEVLTRLLLFFKNE